MRSGPKAILYQSTLFRTSELVWVKVAPLAPWRELIRWSLVAAGFAFYLIVAEAKNSYWNVEGFLGLLAWHVGYYIQSEVRLASTGDLQESYESRGGGGSAKTFRQWVSALSEGENECKLNGPRYNHWFNLERIAWAGPCWLVEWYPLVLIPVFLAYRWLITLELPFHHAILDEVHFLSFEASTGFVNFLSLLIAFLGLAGWATSISPGVTVRACGGLEDRVALSGADRDLFLNRLAGLGDASSSAPPKSKPKVQEDPLPVPAPVVASAPPQAEPEPQAAEV
ncbi:hypothetical protein JST97_34335 [bacterium]|nr:hypothetical protein [bacterium]